MKAHHNCPVQATINVLSGKWKVQAVWYLSFVPRRFADFGIFCEASAKRCSPRSSVNWRKMVSSTGSQSLSRSGRTLIRSSKIFATGAPNSLGSRQICHGIPEQ